MPRRPRQHILEDLARAELHRVFEEFGWAVEDLKKDYGEDLLVRIFDKGVATPYFVAPGCMACPCNDCGAGFACCTYPGDTFPICVQGNTCP